MSENGTCEPGKSARQPYWTIKLPGGIEAKFGGKEIFSIILISIFGFFVYGLIQAHDTKSETHAKTVVEALEATTYVLTLTQDERVKLNLAKPKRIREMERQ